MEVSSVVEVSSGGQYWRSVVLDLVDICTAETDWSTCNPPGSESLYSEEAPEQR